MKREFITVKFVDFGYIKFFQLHVIVDNICILPTIEIEYY